MIKFDLLDEDSRGEQLKNDFTYEKFPKEITRSTSFMDKHEEYEERSMSKNKVIKRKISNIYF